MSLSPEIQAVLQRYDKALSDIEDKAKPFLSTPAAELIPQLNATENAKLNLVYGYTLNSLFYMYLKVNGVSPGNHPVKSELERIKRYMGKTLKAEAEKMKSQTIQKETPTKKRKLDDKGEVSTVSPSKQPKSSKKDKSKSSKKKKKK